MFNLQINSNIYIKTNSTSKSHVIAIKIKFKIIFIKSNSYLSL